MPKRLTDLCEVVCLSDLTDLSEVVLGGEHLVGVLRVLRTNARHAHRGCHKPEAFNTDCYSLLAMAQVRMLLG